MLWRPRTNKKPPRWNASVGMVHPHWRWVWRDLVCMVPFWEGAGFARNIVNPRISVTHDAIATPWTWTNTIHGMAVSGSGGSGGPYGLIAGSGADTRPPLLELAGSWTIAALANANFATADSIGNGNVLLGKGENVETAGRNHNFLMGYDKNVFNDDQAGNGWYLLFERSDSVGANVSAKGVASVAVGDRVLVMGVLDTVLDQMRVYVNGVKLRTRSTAFTGEVNDRFATIGSFAYESPITHAFHSWKGTFEAVWIWRNRAFTDQEAWLLNASPYASITPWRLRKTSTVAPASTARSYGFIIG